MPHRNKLSSLLHNYLPTASAELQFKADMLAFIQQYPNCFERTLEIGHITASAWILNKDKSAALLMHHAKLNRWFQLGGHCDGDADVLAVAIKEAQEESGIMGIVAVSSEIFDIDIHLIPANSREKEHYHYDVRFLLQVVSDEEVVQNSESKELRWITADLAQLPTNSPSVVRMFEKWISADQTKGSVTCPRQSAVTR
jgi:8-oxo-dGTP pyrophosphatase MutT (NUDIX family)